MQGPPGAPYYAPRPPSTSGMQPGLQPPPGAPALQPGGPPSQGPPGAPHPGYGAPQPPTQPPVSQFQQMKVGAAPPGPQPPAGGPMPATAAAPPGYQMPSAAPRPGFPPVANGGTLQHAPQQPQYRPPGPAPSQPPPAQQPPMAAAPQRPSASLPGAAGMSTAPRPPYPQPQQQPPGAAAPPRPLQQQQQSGFPMQGPPRPVAPAHPQQQQHMPPSMAPPGPRPPVPGPTFPGAPAQRPLSGVPGLQQQQQPMQQQQYGGGGAPAPPALRLAGSVPSSPSNTGTALNLGSPSKLPTGPPAPGPGPPGAAQGAPFMGQQHPIGGLQHPQMPGAPPPGQYPHPQHPPQGMHPPTGFPQHHPPGAAPPRPGFPAPPTSFGAPPQLSTPAGGFHHPPSTPMSPPGTGGFAPPTFGGPSAVPQPGSNAAPGMMGGPPGVPSAPVAQGMAGRNIDPGSMPRPAAAPPPTQVFETRRENTHTIPPPCEAPIVVRDCGSAGPRYMRSSLNSVPQGPDILKASSLPFVVMINPLALPEAGDSPLDIVDSGPGGPMRCANCKAYVNPYMRWIENGRKMECCFCEAATDVPPEYFSHVAGDGTRRDKDERPELSKGSVEFEVAGEYLVRPPVPPTFFFLIEVTAGAVGSGSTAAVCASLAQLLDELPGGDNTRVGIATFDSRVHFYVPKAAAAATSDDSGDQPKMLVMSDVNEPFCPLSSAAAAVNLSQHKPALKALLATIPKTFAETQIGDSTGGAALKAAIDTLKTGVGGRLVAFLATMPHAGVLGLRPREAGRPPSERDALEVMSAEGTGYKTLAQEAAEFQVSVDVFALTQGYIDLATISGLCTETSGSLQRYNPFVPAADTGRFHNDLRWCLVRPQGYEAVSRLRVSNGLAVDNYVGAFHKRNPTDLHFPALSCEHAVAARIVHEGRLRENTEVYLQYALLYTTTDGHRRVRVHTLALPVTRSLGSVFRGADLDAYVTYVARKVSSQVPGRTIAALREVVIKAAVETLVAYRKHVATASSSGQLILPESLKLLPLYALGLTKLPCFRTDSRADSRAVWMFRLLTYPVERILPTLHPRLLELQTLPERPSNAPKVPEKLWLTAERLDPEGIFLLENGFDAHLYVGSAVPHELCTGLLGVPSPDQIDLAHFAGPPALDTPLSKAVLALLDEIRRQRKSYMHLRLMRRGHPQEAAFMASLIEDRSPSAGMSYVEMLCMLHRQIQNKLT